MILNSLQNYNDNDNDNDNVAIKQSQLVIQNMVSKKFRIIGTCQNGD